MTSSSITIQREIDRIGGRIILVGGGYGEDGLILWRLGDGRQVIETNGDPVWEHDAGFETLLDDLI